MTMNPVGSQDCADANRTTNAATGSLDLMIRPASSVDHEIVLSAPSMRCGACVARIEDALGQIPGVETVRANLTLKRIELRMANQPSGLDTIFARLAELGHPATEIDATDLDGEGQDETATALLRAVAIAGFGAMNVMLLSVSVWSGAEGAMRAGFHWVSALIAIPVTSYSGRFFFTSAWSALRAARMNMDVPIAVGLLLALALSLSETLRGAQHVFFDAALALTFFLLIGRYLDHRMQSKARHELTALSRLIPGAACQVLPDGQTREIAPTQITPGMVLRIHAGQRLPVDLRIQSGTTDLDRSIVTGESDAVMAAPGDEVEAGALNLTGPVEAVALRAMQDSFIAEMKRMLGSVNGARTRYVRIADRVARLYAPAIHVLAGATFLGWYLSTGDWHLSAFVAISVLIIEKAKFPREHVGESQLPGIGAVLDEMGVWDKMEAAEFPIKIGATYRWGNSPELWDFEFIPLSIYKDEGRPGKFEGQRRMTAWQVDRAIYDDILLRHAESVGVEVWEETAVRGAEVEGDRIRSLTLDDGRIVFNPGSVGRPSFNMNDPVSAARLSPAAAYAIVELSAGKWHVNLRQVAYDNMAASAMARAWGNETWARDLAEGRTR